MKDLTTERLRGYADARLDGIVARLDAHLAADRDLSFQVAAFHNGAAVLDAWGGPHLSDDSVIVPYSATKSIIGLSVGLLVERAELDLDERVAYYWPEFAAKGKSAVTVRQLLSHQAGLPQATPSVTWVELLDHHAAAERLAASPPFWHPGTAFGYHAVTMGNLGDELVYRLTGRTLHGFYEQEIRARHGVDFFLGLPPEHEERLVPGPPMISPVSARSDPPPTPLGLRTWATPGPPVDIANDEVSWRYGHPAVSGSGSARGLARLFAAAVTGVEGARPFLSPDTVWKIGEQQIRGYDEVLAVPDRAHAIVFQKPSPQFAFGGPRAFGHDGGMGALGCVDPDTGVAFAWMVNLGQRPAGADPRALVLAAELGEILPR